MKLLIIGWILAVMNALAAPATGVKATSYGQETVQERESRYSEIATAIYDVAFDDTEAPLYKGKTGRFRTAALIAAVASRESGFHKDVDFGTGKRGVGDHGSSFCMMQMHIGKGKTEEGWTGADLVSDRTKCFRAGLHAMRTSLKACSGKDPLFGLSAYASGSCDSTAGQRASQYRIETANWVVRKVPIPDLEEKVAEK